MCVRTVICLNKSEIEFNVDENGKLYMWFSQRLAVCLELDTLCYILWEFTILLDGINVRKIDESERDNEEKQEKKHY